MPKHAMRMTSRRTALVLAAVAGGAVLLLLAIAAVEGRTPQSLVFGTGGGGLRPPAGNASPGFCCPPNAMCASPPGMQPLAAYCCGCCYWVPADSGSAQSVVACAYQCGASCCSPCGGSPCAAYCPTAASPQPA